MKRIGKYIAYLLRHNPEDLKMDKHGWVPVNQFLKKCKIDMETLEEVVATDNKQRYSFNEDKSKIRANQGHSIDWVEIEMEETEPPLVLFHGTSTRFLKSIEIEGLKSMTRQHVHLSSDEDTAYNVGRRHCKGNDRVAIIVINSHQMYEDGISFYLSENKVWLTDYVDPKYFSYLVKKSVR